jgi:SAM-dependent methyltransferase
MATSLRDPNGHVRLVNNRLIRVVNPAGLADLQAFLRSAASAQFLQSEKLVNTRFLDPPAIAEILQDQEVRCVYEQLLNATIVEHDRVWFSSFPYEWPAEMLHAAAQLTLDFAERLLDDGFGLKDASPYNVLFRGPCPVFVDLLSFEPRDADDPTWLPLAQFVRTFLLPLLVNKHFGIGLGDLLVTHRDGLEPQEVFRLLNPLQKFLPRFLTLVSIPTWLSAPDGAENPQIYRKRKLQSQGKARFIMRGVLSSMRHKLATTSPRVGRNSPWSDYMDKKDYSLGYFPRKQSFVSEVMSFERPAKVLDVGCNTGHFSAIAARTGASVVAIDSDAVVVGQVWRQAEAEHLDIMPLVVNIARPTPAIGWRNSECASFLDRARGQFDAVMMLGLVHHLLVSERIPLTEVISLAAELTTKFLLIEFVAPDDQMFRRITRGYEQLYTYLTKELFEETCRKYFDIVRLESLHHTKRWLYLMKKKEVVIECFETQQ